MLCIKLNNLWYLSEPEWGRWSSWSACTRSCEGGTQRRSRLCISGNCLGIPVETRACNTQACRVRIGSYNINYNGQTNNNTIFIMDVKIGVITRSGMNLSYYN